MRMRWLLVVCALGGCDAVFGLQRPGGSPDAYDPASQCPAAYVAISPGLTSRYKLDETTATYPDHKARCTLDDPHFTHLALVTTTAEGFAVRDVLSASKSDLYFVGLEQLAAATPRDGWHWLDGTPLDDTLWGLTEPDDNGGGEDGFEQRAVMQRDVAGGLFVDTAELAPYRAICECDGIALQ